jgi:hypothetical protein
VLAAVSATARGMRSDAVPARFFALSKRFVRWDPSGGAVLPRREPLPVAVETWVVRRRLASKD